MVRLPGICNQNWLTVVLAHFRMAGICGIGRKPPDPCGAWACSDCHDAIDRRTHLELERDYLRLAHLEGVIRTLAALHEEGWRMRK